MDEKKLKRVVRAALKLLARSRRRLDFYSVPIESIHELRHAFDGE